MYDADYFLRGKETGKSLYTNYSWLPDLTLPMARRIVEILGIRKDHKVLDYGCSRGYLVKALRELGYNAYGCDTSEWAIENCDSDVRGYVTGSSLYYAPFDWVIAKDVLEHIHGVEGSIKSIGWMCDGIFAVVPLSDDKCERYVIPDYEKDVTHVVRWPLVAWLEAFRASLGRDWIVFGSHRIEGIKDNWYKPGWELGNGFIVARRRGG